MNEPVKMYTLSTCGHCKAAVMREISAVAGVQSVDVDLDTKLVTVIGKQLDDEALHHTKLFLRDAANNILIEIAISDLQATSSAIETTLEST